MLLDKSGLLLRQYLYHLLVGPLLYKDSFVQCRGFSFRCEIPQGCQLGQFFPEQCITGSVDSSWLTTRSK